MSSDIENMPKSEGQMKKKLFCKMLYGKIINYVKWNRQSFGCALVKSSAFNNGFFVVGIDAI